ncbi:hypothetical protein ES703_19531 [subsurface metagenome]
MDAKENQDTKKETNQHELLEENKETLSPTMRQGSTKISNRRRGSKNIVKSGIL